MTADNRTSEQVEAAAKALHETRNPWFAAYGDWGAAGFEIKQAFRESARAALVAAQGAARPVNSFDTTAEHAKNGGDSLHVASQEPSQNETKSGNNFVSLDPEKVAHFMVDHREAASATGGDAACACDRTWRNYREHAEHKSRALCEAYTEGKLT